MPEKQSSLSEAYQALLASGDLQPNPAQAETVALLQQCADRLDGYDAATPRAGKSFGALLGSLFREGHAETPLGDGKCGFYIYGQVGRGKSMLMDLFMDHVSVARKRRVHFHQFMLEIHARLNELRQNGGVDDIMENLAQGIAAETSLLAFDEFHVSNIADAMILGRLFEGLFTSGVAIVTTSNWAPDDLYKNGLQRDRFLPFIEQLKQKMLIHEIGGGTDYRYEQVRNLKSYFSPLGLETTRTLQGIFFELTHEVKPESIVLPVEGRKLVIERAAQGTGFFNFDELCEQALGAADYLAIAKCLHTLILDGVPVLKAEKRNEAVRFMTLIDTLYEAHVKLFMATAVPIPKLTPAEDLIVPFQRTTSRLMEMEGKNYRLRNHLS